MEVKERTELTMTVLLLSLDWIPTSCCADKTNLGRTLNVYNVSSSFVKDWKQSSAAKRSVIKDRSLPALREMCANCLLSAFI